jgi:hypothetical protein
MSEHEAELADVELGRCHDCALLLPTEADLSRHMADAHGDEEPAAA